MIANTRCVIDLINYFIIYLYDWFNVQYHEIHAVFLEISLVTLTEVKRAVVGEEGEFTHENNQSD